MCSDTSLFLLPVLSRELSHFSNLSPKSKLENRLNCILLDSDAFGVLRIYRDNLCGNSIVCIFFLHFCEYKFEIG